MNKTIKILISIILLTVCLSLTACPASDSELIGTYKFYSMDAKGHIVNIGDFYRDTLYNENTYTLIFKKDHTFSAISSDGKSDDFTEGTWEKKGKDIILTTEDISVNATLNGNTLILYESWPITLKKINK